jgi:hypothetical protein
MAREDLGATLRRGLRVQDDEAGIIDPAVPIGKAAHELGLERPTSGVPRQVERRRAGHGLAPVKMIVEEEAGAQHPARALAGHVREHEAQGPDDVRRLGKQHLALTKCFAHETECVVLEIAQTAMDELGACRAGGAAEIPHFREQDGQPAAGGVRRDAAAVHAAANDRKIVCIRRSHASAACRLGSGRPNHPGLGDRVGIVGRQQSSGWLYPIPTMLG